MWYVALPNGPLPSLFEWWPWGPKWPCGGGGGGGGVLGSKMKYTSKSSSPELLGSGAGNLVCSIAWWSFTKFVQTKVPGSKMAPRQGVLGSNHRNA